ncbi:MAG: hypothetical protein JWN30_1626 [Bacilli bacterium]|nr:hypothetical protein [Bacilli bacterium]
MGKKVSMQQIANALGLSKFAVSNALSGKGGVSAETRNRILETARLMGYEKKLIKLRDLPTNQFDHQIQSVNTDQLPLADKKKFILIYIDAVRRNSSFWEKILSGITRGCETFGCDHLITSPPSPPLDVLFPDYIDLSACIGVILVGTLPSDTIGWIQQQLKLPTILVDHEDAIANLDSVVNDNIYAGKLACRYLLTCGCQTIVFVGNNQFSVSFHDRYWGSYIVMKETSILSKPLQYWQIPYYQENLQEDLLAKLNGSKLDQFPIGFVCANDDIAVKLITLLNEHNYEIPADFKVIGIDNDDKAPHTKPPLTSVNLCKEELGYRAVVSLFQRVNRPGKSTEKVLLSAELIIRQSC